MSSKKLWQWIQWNSPYPLSSLQSVFFHRLFNALLYSCSALALKFVNKLNILTIIELIVYNFIHLEIYTALVMSKDMDICNESFRNSLYVYVFCYSSLVMFYFENILQIDYFILCDFTGLHTPTTPTTTTIANATSTTSTIGGGRSTCSTRSSSSSSSKRSM